MKHFYFTISLFLISFFTLAQNYEYSVVENSSTNFSIVATPDFTSSGNTDISDIGFSILLPAGDFEANNLTQFYGRTWTTNTAATAAMLTSAGLGDGTKDLVVFNLSNASQTSLSHSNGQEITLVTFDITNNPSSGQIELLPNSDQIALTFAPAADSFYNSDISSSGSYTDYFGGIAAGGGSQTLSVNDIAFEDADVSIYPNPTRGNLTIETNKPISYSIFNILGQSVKLRGKLESDSNKSISLSHLPDGIYILKAEDENNNSKSFKIIKKE